MPSKTKDTSGYDDLDWGNSIRSVLKSAKSRGVKDLRKQVLLSLQLDDSDKAAKKRFKRAIQELEKKGTISLDASGTVALQKEKTKKKRKRDKEPKETSKKGRSSDKSDSNDPRKEQEEQDPVEQEEKLDTQENETENEPAESTSRNKPCKGNPQGVTRLFLGNLPFAIDESSLAAFLPGEVTHIKWITDKETGKFYGSAFIEMNNSVSAADAVGMAGEKLIGRPIKINFAPAREGDIWPPVKKVVSGGGQAGGSGIKAMSANPDNCLKLFIGNLSYDIDDDGITKFFAGVDAEVKAVRWLHHQDSGDFKGCGFVEFWNSEACEKGATLNGKHLLGRPIRIDWTD